MIITSNSKVFSQNTILRNAINSKKTQKNNQHQKKFYKTVHSQLIYKPSELVLEPFFLSWWNFHSPWTWAPSWRRKLTSQLARWQQCTHPGNLLYQWQCRAIFVLTLHQILSNLTVTNPIILIFWLWKKPPKYLQKLAATTPWCCGLSHSVC